MKKGLFVLLCLGLLLAMSCTKSAAPVHLVQAEVESAQLGMHVHYTILLPAEYAKTDVSYPVVYWLHGEDGIADTQVQAIRQLLDQSGKEKTVVPMIYVIPDLGQGALWVDVPEGPKQESFVIKDLIPHIDKTYRTLADKGSRAMEGFGTGGAAALLYGCKYPELFGTALSYAADMHNWESLDEERKQLFRNDEALYNKSSAWYWMNEHRDAMIPNVFMRMVVGMDDSLEEANFAFVTEARRLHVPVDYENHPGIGHTYSGFNLSTRQFGLKFLSLSFGVERKVDLSHSPWPERMWMKPWLVKDAHLDLEFAKAGDKSLKLDIFTPKTGEGPYPLIVWIYGGGWMRGHKRLNRSKRDAMLKRGYAYAGITYRLSGEAAFPAQIHDCKAGVRWLRAHAQQYNLNPDRFGAFGVSAGGHLVALLGTSGDVKEHTVGQTTMDVAGTLGDHDDVSARLQAVCDMYGPADLAKMALARNPEKPHTSGSVGRLCRGDSLTFLERCKLASPTTYVDKDDPPFFILHGKKDNLVPFDQSETLYGLLKEAYAGTSTEVTFHVEENAGHGGARWFDADIEIMMGDFFDRTLKR